LADYRKQFNLTTEVKFFPHGLSSSVNLKLPKAPEFQLYHSPADTRTIRMEKYKFWTSIKDLPFCYVDALEKCADSELEICSLAGLNFARASMSFQEQCLLHFGKPVFYKNDCLPVVSAFKFNSLPNFVKTTFRTFALPRNVLYSIRDQYGGVQPASILEHEVTEFLRFKEPRMWTTLYSSARGQRKFFRPGEKKPFLIADAYNERTKTCFLFNGCYWHCHPTCQQSPLGGDKEKKELNEAKYERLCHQIETLLKECAAEVTTVSMLWECEYLELKKPRKRRNKSLLRRQLPPIFEALKMAGRAELAAFLAGPLLRPRESMVIRDAFSGSLSEAYALKYVKKEGDGKRCHVLDVSSLFPFVGITCPMPVGPYHVVVGDDLLQQDVTFESETMLHKGAPVSAIVHSRVFPPDHLVHPFLHTQVNGAIVGTLCKLCSEQCVEQGSNLSFCTHTDFERSFVGTFTSQELAYASTLGYRYTYLQLMVYPKTDFVLRKYLTLLGFYKLSHCQFPKNVEGDPKLQEEYCRELNRLMNFRDILGMELTPSLVTPNQQMRSFFKAALNSFLGTFGTNVEKYTSVRYLNHYSQLEPLLQSDRLVDMCPVNDTTLRVTLAQKETYPSRVNNVAISCVVTSMARVFVHKKIQELVALGAVILRVSCDCIYFVCDENMTLPVQISEAFGCYKEEFDDVVAVAQAGLRNISVLHRQDGQLKEHFITSGTTINEENCASLTHGRFSAIVDALLSKEVSAFKQVQLSVQQSRTYRRLCNSTAAGTVARKTRRQAVFSKSLLSRRLLQSNTTYKTTLPFGIRKTERLPGVFYLAILLTLLKK
jgi:G:T-mismatch repair DNA endonuclease (very short patch repair protein)